MGDPQNYGFHYTKMFSLFFFDDMEYPPLSSTIGNLHLGKSYASIGGFLVLLLHPIQIGFFTQVLSHRFFAVQVRTHLKLQSGK